MYIHIFLVFFFLLLVDININGFQLSKNSNSNEIHLEAPHLTDKSQSARPPLESLTNSTRRRTKPKKVSDKDLFNPCNNGSYMKTNGTTCGLKEIMIGRCLEFEYIKGGFNLHNRS